MPITQSTIIDDKRQIDGRRYISERHVDQTGKVYVINYLAGSSDDAARKMTDRVLSLNEQLRSREIQNNLDAIDNEDVNISPVLSFNHSTPEDLGPELRIRFKDAKGVRACRIAEWLFNRTLSQLVVLFDLSNNSFARDLKDRLQAKIDIMNQLRNQSGE